MGITLSSMQRRLQQARDLLLQIPWRKTPQATLPSDVIFDILSRVPAKSMCRFRIRCVSRECRDRISDPVFIAAAQKRRPPEQLLVVGSDRDMSLRLVDMDGSVVRVIDGMSRRWVPVSTSPDGFVCVTTGFSKDDNLAGVIDLTTMKMPVTHLKSDRAWGYGRAVTSGAYKMVRLGFHHCEVLTVGDDEGWRRRKCPPFRFDG
ncbi:putative F-box protein At1g47765 [Aegilops tauschii subsp. strangulata]|uniref:putative F-box protein At1g47765 n=1 Tax=Aegilops tauschii subsp. strangulata TaxID=200361 RepID=UPI00098AE3E8|nr:putative F-box protein At1g47765 [Aegilops tauschii subsp. strangulata]